MRIQKSGKILALIKQVLTPLIVALGKQSHQVPARVQAERTRGACQFETGFFRRAAAFAIIARMAAGHQIFPRGFAGARSRHHVIESELARRHRPVAILASVAIAHQDVLTRESPRLAGNPPVFEEADHACQPHRVAREVNRAGYATDPSYAAKLIGLMDRYNLYRYDDV